MNQRTSRTLLTVFALALASATAALAQEKPNLTGTWKQNNEKSTVRPGSGLQSYTNKIEHQDPNLRVTTIMVGSRGETTFERVYTTDGKEQKRTDREGDEFTTTVKWEGSILVFETVEKEGGTILKTREIWNLFEDGKTLTKMIHRSGPRGETEQKYVLERQ